MKICIQAGHEGRTSGSTGANGEQAFNIDVSNKLADKLRANGFEVKRVKADPADIEIAGDWDLFLSVHYDADIYGSGGGFLDRPKYDGAEAESKRILEVIEGVYFLSTGIVNKPERRNANTNQYYMWARLSAKTPCVLIECGVGQHRPDDYEVLFNNRDRVVSGIYNGILKAFNMGGEVLPPEQENMLLKYLGMDNETDAIKRLAKHLGGETNCEWGDEKENKGGHLGSARREVKKLKADLTEAEIALEQKTNELVKCQADLDTATSENGENEDTAEFVLNGMTETFEKDGKTVTLNYAVQQPKS